jgi:MFS family permease
LKFYNFRLYYLGQGISLCGTWMQTVALSWLVLQLTGAGTQLGLVIAAQYLPILIFGAAGGVVADRFNRRRVLLVTQSLAGLLALTLGLLVVTHIVQLWMVYAVAIGLGLVLCVDNPTRQAFVSEMVGPSYLKNAVTLNSVLVNSARIVGPSFAGILIATIGTGPCFLVNSATYIGVLTSLFFIKSDQLHERPIFMKQPQQVRAGLRYIWHDSLLRSTLVMMFVIGTLAYEFPVTLPLFASRSLHGGAATYSAMTAATAIGALAGGLFAAGRVVNSQLQHARAAIWFGLSVLVMAAAPTITTALIALVINGALSISFMTLGNTTLQLRTDPRMRGRVMALWSVAYFGTTPIGGPIVGALSDRTNPRIGIALGGMTAIITGLVVWLGRRHQAPAAELRPDNG